MKSLLGLLTLVVLTAFFPAQWAAAGGNLRNSLSEKWKEAQTFQRSQDKRFKALEREAQRIKGDADLKRKSFQTAPSNNRDRRPR